MKRTLGMIWIVAASASASLVAHTHSLSPPQRPPLTRPKQIHNPAARLKERAMFTARESVDPSSHSTNTNSGDDSQLSLQDRRQRTGMSIALTTVYFSVMAAKCALPATLSLLINPSTGLKFGGATGFASTAAPQQVFATILFTSTSAIAVGKVLLGPVIDYFGGVLSLQVSLLTLAALLSIISVSSSIQTFAICWVLVDFIFSSCWAACINAIHQSFPDAKDWPSQIARLAAAARTGNAAAFAIFASLLQFAATRTRQAWRPIFAVSAVLQLLPVALLTINSGSVTKNKHFAAVKQTLASSRVPLPRLSIINKLRNKAGSADTATKPSSPTGGPLRTLRREARTLEFWCHLTSRSLLMVFASFLLFVPTLMNQVYQASSSAAARVGSLYAIGCLLSVMTGSGRYAKMSRRNKMLSMASLLGLATLSSLAQLGHVTGAWTLSLTASAVSMFAWGFSFALPFYLPPSLFALKRGGTESSATIADVFDIGGFALLACFNGYVAGLNHASKAAWAPVFQMTTVAAAVALVALSVATWKEGDV